MRNTLPWHQMQWQRFFSFLEKDRLPHALLLSGDVGLGKRQFAKQAAQILFCEHRNACEKCNSCQLFLSGNHPDFYLLEATEESTVIKIDTIRELTEKLTKTAVQSGHKVVLISNADSFNTASANALLKLLEEPPQKTIFILVSDNPSLLLRTIKSRCQEIRFAPSYSAETQQWLQGQGVTHELLDWAQGAPLTALHYAQDEILQQNYRAFEESWQTFLSSHHIFSTVDIWIKLPVIDVMTWLLKVCQEKVCQENIITTGAAIFISYDKTIELRKLLHRQPNLNMTLQYAALLSYFID